MNFLKPENRHPVLVVAVVTVGLFVALLVWMGMSQSGPTQPSDQTNRSPASKLEQDVTDRQLEQFAFTQREIADIQAMMKERMLQANEQAAVEQAEKEASSQMVAAIHRNGLNVEEYSMISQAIQDDAQIFERFREIQLNLDSPAGTVE